MKNKELSFSEIVSLLPNYEKRDQQIKMANVISNCLEKREHLIVEAGTGSGKSFAYLYPVISHGVLTIISTGTITLQEQLLEKDIPFLMSVPWKEFKAVITKGRGNYYCIQKFWELDRLLSQNDPLRYYFDRLSKIKKYWNGDFGDLEFELPEKLKLELESSSEDCLIHKCEFFQKCPFRKARSEMEDANIIITNHALYFIDIITNSGILPDHEFVVFDEAHHLLNAATNALTISIGRYAIMKLIQKIRRRVSQIPDRINNRLISEEANLMGWLFRRNKPFYRLYPDNEFINIVDSLIKELENLKEWLVNLDLKQLTFDDKIFQVKADLHRQKLIQQVNNLILRYKFFVECKTETRVNWVEINNTTGYFELKSAPLNISEDLQKILWNTKTTISTSATIAVKKDFSYFKEQIGLNNVNELVLESPFDFKKQVALFIPKDLPDPNSSEFLPSIYPLLKDILTFTQGRAFLLFSSWRNMEETFNNMIYNLNFPIKKQGDLPRKILLEWFKNTSNSVLFATATFWEGIDIPGDSLSCIIIDKLPFSVPDDPIIEAKIEKMKSEGKNWFYNFMLPEAIIRLRQGCGRLIRTKSDTGLIVILDNRILKKSYGRTILQSLPKVNLIKELKQAEKFIHV